MITIADLRVDSIGTAPAAVEGRTPGGDRSIGRFHTHRIEGPNGPLVDIAYVTWRNGERNIQPLRTHGPTILDHLASGRRRLTLIDLEDGTYYSLLKQARAKFGAPNEWSGLFKATRQELDEGCGADAYQVLLNAGALRVGAKEEVTSITDRQHTWPTAVYAGDDMLAPCVAFAITRVIPLVRGYSPQLRFL